LVIFPLNAGSVRLFDPGTSPKPEDFWQPGHFRVCRFFALRDNDSFYQEPAE
jgi:hypothetical protein